MVAERAHRINRAVDWVWQEQCGCKVIFLGSCLHHTTKMEPCLRHSGPSDAACDRRSVIVANAKSAYREAQAR